MAEIDALASSESSFSGPPTEASSQVASLTSTPPTSASPDSISLASEHDTPKPISIATPLLEEPQLPQQQHGQQQLDIVAGLQPQHAVEQHGQEQAAAEPQPDPKPGPEPELDPGQQTPIAHAIIVAAGAAEASTPSQPPSTGRSRRARANAPVYNLAKLSGTDVHGKRRANGDEVREKRRRTISGDVPAGVDPAVRDGIDALNLDWSIPGPNTPRAQRTTTKASAKAKLSPAGEPVTRRTTRLSGAATETLATKVSALGKRSRATFEKGLSRLSREIKRLRDTDEFAHIDDRPVVHTVWSNGKFVDPYKEAAEAAAAERARKRAKTDAGSEAQLKRQDDTKKKEEEATEAKAGLVPTRVRPKKWLEKGLYAGQAAPTDITKGLTAAEKKKLSQIPQLASGIKANKSLPMPMFNGLRLLLNGRDFKLPYDVCNPLPPGQPKPAAYRTMTKNRFVGGAGAYWKKTPHFKDFQSKCVCKPEDGCAEQCQNRIMLYECDETNCNIGKPHCTNRAFQNLQERTKQGGRFRIGVEVVKTGDRGYGVRSNRCFEPNQIIMEYTGEIITEEEGERRMKEVYKDNECYYLMSFDQNMIIDATTGSIARFVNHSCSPNSRMIKWIVSGQPRMALFAGDEPIMTGEELTYDYNFDPFSNKNVQKCLCGSENCRGVLGPKSKEVKPVKPAKPAKPAKATGKRKLKDLLGGVSDDESGAKSAKKRKLTKKSGPPTRILAVAKKRSLPSLGTKAAKGAATAIRRSVSTISLGAKAALASKNGGTSPKRRASTGGRIKVTTPGKKNGGREVIRTTKAAIAVSMGRSPSGGRTIVAKAGGATGLLKAGDGNRRTTPKKKLVATPAGKGGSGSIKKKGGKVAVATPSSTSSKRGGKKKGMNEDATTVTVSVKKTPSFSSPRKRVPSRKVLEAEADLLLPDQSGSAKKSSPNGGGSSSSNKKKSPIRSPRKGLELSRAAKVRLVEDSD